MKSLVILENFDLQNNIVSSLMLAGVDSQDLIPCPYKDSGLFLKDPSISLIIIEISPINPNASFQIIDHARSSNEAAKIIAIIHEKESELLIQLVKRGVSDLLSVPLNKDELVGIIKKLGVGGLGVSKSRSSHSGPKGRVVLISSYKGGTGVSTIAANLGFGLSDHPAIQKKTLILDLANQSNHCSILLDADTTFTINQICKSVNKMESSYIFSSCAFINPNLAIIGTDPGTDGLEKLEFEPLSRAIELFTECFDYIIIDLATHSFDERLLACLDKADQILLTTTIDITSIRDTRLYLKMIKEMGIDNAKIRILVNRYDCQSGMFKTKDLEQALQNPISFYVPNDYAACSNASQAGEAISEHSPKSMIAEALTEVAIGIDSGALFVPPKTEAKKKGGLSGILAGLRK
jgi:pilus assembly protein CpaE